MEGIMSEIFQLPTHILYEKFKKHIDIENNQRILFSGKFGTGKTTFLKDFFDSHKEEYDVYHLFPINYQIRSIDDIVDLIRYDLLVSLMKKHPDAFASRDIGGVKGHAVLWKEFITSRFTVNDALQTTISYMEDCLEVAETILPAKISQLGRPLKDILNLDKQFQEFKMEYKKGDFAKVETFMQDLESKEPDALSYLLSQKINEKKGEKKSVLILDDLDRIDPAHIFRILNVLSAFHDQDGDGNKFGFDKIIVVGDICNIRYIFKHFYGSKTDFNGYIDKFYSYTTYNFSNEETITSQINQIVKLMGTQDEATVPGFENGYFINETLSEVLVEINQIAARYNLRQLPILIKFSMPLLGDCDYKKPTNFNTQDENSVEAILFSLRVLGNIFQSNQTLESILKDLAEHIPNKNSQRYKSDRYYKHYNKSLLHFITDGTSQAPDTLARKNNAKFLEGQIVYETDIYPDLNLPRKMYFSLLGNIVHLKLHEKK